ncbi:hypothetical protein LL033_13635 [Clostridium estertheticum]|uniref:cyclophilin-like fold protein n=1 Tax=Clostridium estertheticum TaxID=238834 RepID=UPI001C0C30EB|nr:cyclophilin-like fold protein [Clostridium estertheticum]MBU3213818.1 hypothetical protein [Clostridium estertheticum]WAG53701.1 hypothetical protein LL033_13635 [Clostridium estertheticum]
MKNIVIKAGNVIIPATLNVTVAAKDFETRMPFAVKGTDSGIDYCCVASEGKSKSSEKQTGWKNGDINLAGGWFALLYGGEEQSQAYSDMMIIGHIDEENLQLVKDLPDTVTFTVELA